MPARHPLPGPVARRSLIRALAVAAGFALAWSRPPIRALGQELDVEGPSTPSWPVAPPDPPPSVAADAAPAPPAAAEGAGPPSEVAADAEFEPSAVAEAAPAAGPWGVPPVKLVIPSLAVEAAVEPVGQDPDGAMSTPTDPDDVAWYKLGPGMGVPGNVVLAAHVNWDGRLRVFGQLHLLEDGDVVQVIDAEGRGYEYAVESSHWVRAEGAPIEEIFAQPPEPVITLITCGGEFVPSRREYLDRLIVRARGV